MLTELNLLPMFDINPYMAPIDSLLDLLPNDLMAMNLIYSLIDNSYFKVSEIRYKIDKTRFKSQVDT